MAGKGSYLGGSTRLKPWRDDAEEGWEPQSVVTGMVPKNVGGQNSKQATNREKRNGNVENSELEKHIEKYAKACAIRQIKGEAWEAPSQILKNHFGKKISYLRNSIRSHKSFIEIVKKHEK